MKTFKEHIAIARPVEDGGADVHDIADPATLKRVNAFVGSIADREYLNANHAISELRQKLMPRDKCFKPDPMLRVPPPQDIQNRSKITEKVPNHIFVLNFGH